MWALVIVVLIVVDGQVREERMRAPAPFATVEECKEAGRDAADAISRLPETRGVGFTCAHVPTV